MTTGRASHTRRLQALFPLVVLAVCARGGFTQGTAQPAAVRADACVDSARAAAGEDRHRDAILWYQRAIALHPPLQADLGKEIGHQYTWADFPDSAITWYRYHLAAHPDDVEAEIGLARALAWSGRYDEAITTYEAALPHAGEYQTEIRLGIARVTAWKDAHEDARALYDVILAAAPGNLDARLGRAQVTNWSGRHREAAAAYAGILADHPGNADAREGLAAAQYWMGRTDLARATLGEGERTPALDAFAHDVERSLAPAGSYTFEHNTDSDDIERGIHTLRAGISTGDLTRVLGEYGHARFEQPGRPDVSRNSLAAVWQQRFSEAAALSAAVGYQWNAFDRAQLGPEVYWKDEFNLLTVDAYLTYTPRDWMRWDFGLFHGSLANPDAIFRGIALTELSAGLDWRLRSNLLSASSLDFTFYNDDNRRIGLGERLVWQPLWRVPVRLDHRFTSTTGLGYFGFSETNDNGYYDPRQYLSFYEEVALDLVFSKRARARVSGRFGWDRENGGDWFDVGRFEVSGTAVLHRRVALTAGYYNSDSRLDSREGYQADGFYITVDYVHHD
jgi:tetratricopeptide (TPR) repeat protein